MNNIYGLVLIITGVVIIILKIRNALISTVIDDPGDEHYIAYLAGGISREEANRKMTEAYLQEFENFPKNAPQKFFWSIIAVGITAIISGVIIILWN